jgi:hypothetical protein
LKRTKEKKGSINENLQNLQARKVRLPSEERVAVDGGEDEVRDDQHMLDSLGGGSSAQEGGDKNLENSSKGEGEEK